MRVWRKQVTWMVSSYRQCAWVLAQLLKKRLKSNLWETHTCEITPSYTEIFWNISGIGMVNIRNSFPTQIIRVTWITVWGAPPYHFHRSPCSLLEDEPTQTIFLNIPLVGVCFRARLGSPYCALLGTDCARTDLHQQGDHKLSGNVCQPYPQNIHSNPPEYKSKKMMCIYKSV